MASTFAMMKYIRAVWNEEIQACVLLNALLPGGRVDDACQRVCRMPLWRSSKLKAGGLQGPAGPLIR